MTKLTMFTIERGRWYAWKMLPGYLGSPGTAEPYHSPIKVHEIEPLKTGRGRLRLSFYNAGYPEGVRNFELTLGVLTRQTDYLIAAILDAHGKPSARTGVVHELSENWLRLTIPGWVETNPPRPDEQAGPNGMQRYLDRAHDQGLL